MNTLGEHGGDRRACGGRGGQRGRRPGQAATEPTPGSDRREWETWEDSEQLWEGQKEEAQCCSPKHPPSRRVKWRRSKKKLIPEPAILTCHCVAIERGTRESGARPTRMGPSLHRQGSDAHSLTPPALVLSRALSSQWGPMGQSGHPELRPSLCPDLQGEVCIRQLPSSSLGLTTLCQVRGHDSRKGGAGAQPLQSTLSSSSAGLCL